MRIGTTTIDSFRLFMEPDNDWMPESDLLATIRGETVPNAKMMLGTAFGRCLEKGDKYLKGNEYRVPVMGPDGWLTFILGRDVMAPAFEKFDRRGVFEARATKMYGDVKVVAKVDQLLGTEVMETKATTGYFDFDKYAHAFQWRFLLDLFEGATSVTYNIFLLGTDMGADFEIPKAAGVVSGFELRGIESFTLYPYAELHRDCEEQIARFVEYVRAKGLVDFLNSKQEQSEAFVNELA